MFASIQSTHFAACFCRVHAHPVATQGELSIYRLVGRDPGFNEWLSGRFVGSFDHLAIDAAGNAHLYCMEKGLPAGRIGPVDFKPDEA